MTVSAPIIEARKVRFSYTKNPLLEEIDLTLDAGRITGIVGPNGAGKTTLLNILAGILTPSHGSVTLESRPVGEYIRREIAQRVAMIPPEVQAPFPYSVREVVEMGRYPHADLFRPLDAHDRNAIESALARTGLSGFEGRVYNRLSSGERQRVVIARALAQRPKCLLMDEPTVHLDIHFQVEIHDLMKALASEGLSILVISHDLNLASIYCDQLLLLHRGRIVRSGPPAEVLDADLLSEVYGTRLEVYPHPKTGRPTVWPETHA